MPTAPTHDYLTEALGQDVPDLELEGRTFDVAAIIHDLMRSAVHRLAAEYLPHNAGETRTTKNGWVAEAAGLVSAATGLYALASGRVTSVGTATMWRVWLDAIGERQVDTFPSAIDAVGIVRRQAELGRHGFRSSTHYSTGGR